MKTYLTVWFNSNGVRPSEVMQKLETIGFKAVRGNYDHVYDWGANPNINEILDMGDLIQAKLKKSNIMFKLDTL